MVSLLWLITIILFVLWVLGYAVNIGAWFNFLLVAAVVLLIFNAISALLVHGPAGPHARGPRNPPSRRRNLEGEYGCPS